MFFGTMEKPWQRKDENLEFREFRLYATVRGQRKAVLVLSHQTGTYYVRCHLCGIVQGNVKTEQVWDLCTIENGTVATVVCPGCRMKIEYLHINHDSFPHQERERMGQ